MVSFNNITVSHYQSLYSVQKSDMEDVDKRIELVAAFTGKTIRDVEDMPLPDFNKAYAETITILESDVKSEPKRVITVNGRMYGITYEPKHLRAGQYIEIQEFMKGDIIGNLHKLMASLVYPVKRNWFGRLIGGKNDSERHEIVSEDILDAKFIDVYSACVFFCQLLKSSIMGLESYLTAEMKKKGVPKSEMKRLLKGLGNALDGFIPPQKLQSTKV